MSLFEQDNYLAKREGMKILQEILLDVDNKEFYSYFVEEKDHLKFTMQALNDDSSAIQIEAFYILFIFLKTPKDVRGLRVNETLKKNKEPLMLFVQDLQPGSEKKDESLEKKKEIAERLIEELE